MGRRSYLGRVAYAAFVEAGGALKAPPSWVKLSDEAQSAWCSVAEAVEECIADKRVRLLDDDEDEEPSDPLWDDADSDDADDE